MDNCVQDILSVTEIEAAIDSFSKADWARLNKVARIFGNIYSVESQELLNEAFTRALSGTRKCPRNVQVAIFLANTMKSIGSKHGLSPPKKDALHQHTLSSELYDDTIHASNISTPEKELVASELLEKIVDLFEDDDEAQMLIMCEQDNMSVKEIQEELNIDSTQYASIKKRIRRRYIKLSMEVD